MTSEQQEHWQEFLEAQRRGDLTVAELKVPEVVPILRAVLAAGGPRLDYALRMVENLPEDRMRELFPDLYRAAIAGHPHSVLAGDVLARLDSGWLAFALGPEVQRTLATPDRDSWKQLENLLDHLGQEDLLVRVRQAEGTPSGSGGGGGSTGEPELTADQQRYWSRVIDATDAVIAAREKLSGADAVAVLRVALMNGAERQAAERLAWHLSEEELRELLPELYQAATITHRSILTTRQLIVRLDKDWLAHSLVPLVEATLAEGDEEAYRRLAELLAHLEQYGLLARLVEVAAESDDDEIREIAEDFGD